MKNCVRYVGGMVIVLCAAVDAGNSDSTLNSSEVVAAYFQNLEDGNAEAMSAQFFKTPDMESQHDKWMKFVVRVADKVKEEQLAWEVVCSKELDETAVVIVNQTMKQGKLHADPDALFLVKTSNSWLLLPDMFAPSAKNDVEKAMSIVQVSDRRILRRWAVGEIRGITQECNTK